MNPNVAIVVLNWRGAINTARCVASLQRMSYQNYQIVVVDNGSGEEEERQLHKTVNGCQLVINKKNLGYAGGMNVGIRTALATQKVKYVLLLNNDTEATPDLLTEMINVAEALETDMVSPTVLESGAQNKIDRLGVVLSAALLGYDMKKWEGQQPFCPSGCCALYSRKLLERVREVSGYYFDEDFFMYAEDTDLGWRARLLGFKAVLAERAVIYHKGFASNALASTDPQYLGHRNTVWYVVKNASIAQLWYLGGWWIVGQLVEVLAVILREIPVSVLRAKWHACLGLPKMLRKRRVIQASRVVSSQEIRQAIDPRPFYLYPPRFSVLDFLWRLASFMVKSVRSLSRRSMRIYKRKTR